MLRLASNCEMGFDLLYSLASSLDYWVSKDLLLAKAEAQGGRWKCDALAVRACSADVAKQATWPRSPSMARGCILLPRHLAGEGRDDYLLNNLLFCHKSLLCANHL